MKNATMLYKCPGPHEIHGGQFDHTIVDEDDVEQALADGWHLTTPDAKDAYEAAQRPQADAPPLENSPPTRDELKQKADELQLTYPANIPTAKLAEMIEHALAEQG
jgi:hypothetical protein